MKYLPLYIKPVSIPLKCALKEIPHHQSLKQDKVASTGMVEGKQVLAFEVCLFCNCVQMYYLH